MIVSFGSEGLYAYDIDGKLLWKQDLGVLNAGWFYDPDYEWGVGSSPIIWKNLVIVQCDIQKNSFIAAFDVTTGKPAWRTAREEIPSWSTPAIFEHDGRAELVTQATTFIRGYDPETGKELWRLGGQFRDHDPDADRRPGRDHRHQRLSRRAADFRDQAGRHAATSRSRATRRPTSSSRGARIAAGPYIPTPVIYGDLLYVLAEQRRAGRLRREDRAARLPGAGRPAAGHSARRRSPLTASSI